MTDLFTPLTVVDVSPETASALSVRLSVPATESKRFAFLPGQSLPVRTFIDGQDKRRNYSLVSSPDEPDLTIIIKRIEGGLVSNFLNDTLQIGQTLEAMPPAGRFVLPATDQPRLVIALAAGSGITPIYAIASSLLNREPQSRLILLFGNRTPDDVLLHKGLTRLAEDYSDRFTLLSCFSAHEGSEGFKGRLSSETFARQARQHPALLKGDSYLICGPGTMNEDLTSGMILLGIPRERLLSDHYHSRARNRPTGSDRTMRRKLRGLPIGADPDVMVPTEVHLEGQVYTFSTDPRESILGAARRHDLDLPHSCEAGTCGACRAYLLSGDVEMATNLALGNEELAEGLVLTCQGRARGDKVVLRYPEQTKTSAGSL